MQSGRNSKELKPKKLFSELGFGLIVKRSNVSKDMFFKQNEAVAFASDFSSHGEETKKS